MEGFQPSEFVDTNPLMYTYVQKLLNISLNANGEYEFSVTTAPTGYTYLFSEISYFAGHPGVLTINCTFSTGKAIIMGTPNTSISQVQVVNYYIKSQERATYTPT